MPELEVIDVVSDGPALMEGRGRRALTLDGADAQGRFNDDASESRSDEDDQEDAATTPEEHAYRRGRQAIPMDSPGDEMRGDLLIDSDDEEQGARIGVQRLRRLRTRRGFFHSDSDVRSFRYRSSGGILQKITLRRRKRGEQDAFWTLISVLTVLSFALMSVISIYLTQTDFFESHQNDLFGTTVDNRFTVVAQDDAQILLKSGYSKTVYSEAMIAFDSGELQIGRRALASAETQDFYGVSFFSNGTASFTNRVESPMMEADYLHARKAVVFDDGTVMTTAANSSGGVRELGDLNLVSQSGAVVTSAGGKSLLFVDPSGTVTVANTKSDEPTLSGITLDGVQGSLSIGGGLTLVHSENASSLSTDQALRLNTSTVLLGSPSSGKVRFTVATPDETADEADVVEDGARALEPQDDTEESESVTMEVAGQTTSTLKEGGDVRIVGGDGLQIGGDVVLVGGQATESSSPEYGSITINAELDQQASSLTEIGSHSASHVVNVHGLVSFNHKATHMNNATNVKVAGGGFNVSSQRITLDNRATTSSLLHINSNNLLLGASSPNIQVGKFASSKLEIEAASISLDASKGVSIGGSSPSIIIGNAKTAGQVTKVASSVIELEASRAVAINAHNTEAVTTVSGLVHFNGSSTTTSLVSITDVAVRVNSPKFRVGARGKTDTASIEATHVSIGGPGANATTLPPSDSTLAISSAHITIGSEASVTSLTGTSTAIDAVDTLVLGKEVDSVTIGSEDVNEVNVQGDAVTVTGETTIIGESTSVLTKKVAIGGNSTSDISVGSSTAKKAAIEAKDIVIGSHAQAVNIGSDASVISLSGSVTINGHELDSRRLAEQRDGVEVKAAHYGFLDADRITVAVSSQQQITQFPLRWDSGFSSEPQVFAVEAREGRMLSVVYTPEGTNEAETARHMQVALHVSSVALSVESTDDLTAQASKIRCRVYKHSSAQDASPDIVVLETTAPVEHCFSSTCDEGFFLGLQGQRIVSFVPGDSFSTQCTLASQTGGELVLRGAQYSFTIMT